MHSAVFVKAVPHDSTARAVPRALEAAEAVVAASAAAAGVLAAVVAVAVDGVRTV